VRAMWREPHSGHGIVVVALLVYPLSVLTVVSGVVPPELLSASAVLPFSVLGATLLTTGLLRAQRRAALALAEREQAQALLRATNDSLEQLVTLRTAELRETIDGLESFNRSVSHDLRGPLGGIAGKLAAVETSPGKLASEQRIGGGPPQLSLPDTVPDLRAPDQIRAIGPRHFLLSETIYPGQG